jgi:NAD(P)-dependent dehydrogenase (short-subunit alcohol dehydrogenase family)
MPVLLITGASRGIGAATARMAAKRGYDVAVNYVRDKAAADAVVKDIEAAGRKAVAIQGDMAQEADIERLFDTAAKALGPITHFVYNSGIVGRISRLDAVETQTLREVIDLNIFGALVSLRTAIRRMSKAFGGPGGAIVLIGSATATIGAPNDYVWYAASKAAVETMAMGAAKEVAKDGLRVNTVAPGPIDTDIHEPGRLDRIMAFVPIGRAGTPDEVAEAVLFMLSDGASNITGTTLRVGGGR